MGPEKSLIESFDQSFVFQLVQNLEFTVKRGGGVGGGEQGGGVEVEWELGEGDGSCGAEGGGGGNRSCVPEF